MSKLNVMLEELESTCGLNESEVDPIKKATREGAAKAWPKVAKGIPGVLKEISANIPKALKTANSGGYKARRFDEAMDAMQKGSVLLAAAANVLRELSQSAPAKELEVTDAGSSDIHRILNRR